MYTSADFENFRTQNKLPELDQLRDYSPEEVAQLLLRIFKSYSNAFIPGDAVGNLSDRGYGRNAEAERVFMEGVAFLERYGLLVEELRRYSGTGRGRVLSRQREQLASSASDLTDFISRIRDPRTLLHPGIQANALPLFDRGPKHFETAVFEAFKSVEIAVRDAAGLPNELVGTKLMNQAFGLGGKLRDPKGDPGEEDGIRSLFSGAVASYKNPASHRNVLWEDGKAVLRALIFASELLGIVDSRKPD
jgi:uncharacterized protein (TIGR02391 family)